MNKLSWFAIFRLGLIQTALGSIVVLTTSTLNRVMVVELLLPAMLPGILVGLHSGLQISRPIWGHASDTTLRRTPWILVGMGMLAVGGILAAEATATMGSSITSGVGLAVLAYIMVGVGVGAGGTALLALLASRVEQGRKAVAASIVWLMMIAGFVVTTATAGALLKPFSFERLVEVCTGVSVSAFLVSVLALWGVERRFQLPAEPSKAPETGSFREVLAEVWADTEARAFTIFVFVSMLAYNTQDLILEPFGGAVFGLTTGETTQLTSVQHSGVLLGMVFVALAASGTKGPRFGSVKTWTVAGCLLSGLTLFALASTGFIAREAHVLRAGVGILGFFNGAFAVAAIGWMMSLASKGMKAREGIRMGLWGGAQAIAFAVGGFAGTMLLDLGRLFTASEAIPYALVFVVEGSLFLAAARLAADMSWSRTGAQATELMGGALSPEDLNPVEPSLAQEDGREIA